MEREEAVTCAKCGQLPNDVLILTCDHNLCLKCASLNLKRENLRASQKNLQQQNSFQTVICEICKIATVLDPASATELLTMDHGLLVDQNSDDIDNEYMQEDDI
jgi:predicted nucleic-acid-binding Zn-ribbon protein